MVQGMFLHALFGVWLQARSEAQVCFFRHWLFGSKPSQQVAGGESGFCESSGELAVTLPWSTWWLETWNLSVTLHLFELDHFL